MENLPKKCSFLKSFHEKANLKLGIPEMCHLKSRIPEMSQLNSGIPDLSWLIPGILAPSTTAHQGGRGAHEGRARDAYCKGGLDELSPYCI